MWSSFPFYQIHAFQVSFQSNLSSSLNHYYLEIKAAAHAFCLLLPMFLAVNFLKLSEVPCGLKWPRVIAPL